MAIRRYDEKILNNLLDKYENSLLYSGLNKRRQTIGFPVNRSTLPEYFDLASGQFDIIHAQLLEAEQMGFVQLVWKNQKAGHILEKCLLNPEKADELYVWLHRKPRAEKEAALRSACERNTGRHPVIDRFLFWIQNQLREGKSVRQYVDMDSPEKLDELCSLLYEILTNQEEVFLREFSIRFRKDSKAAERELDHAAGLIARFSGDEALQGLETDQLLEEFGIYRNPSWVMLKGSGRFCIRPFQYLSLADFPGGIGLSSTDIAQVRWGREFLPHQVISIENLTSFHRWQQDDTLAIYLGGYHNKIKRVFLKNLYKDSSGAAVEFAHFGDIDCGGFRIWRDLCEKTGIPFQTRFMDEETYLSHLDFGKPLKESDRHELERMSRDPYYIDQWELFASMLRHGKKIEQECVGAPFATPAAGTASDGGAV